MPDYIPHFLPGVNVTQKVGATPVVGGNLVMLSAANTVIPSTGTTAAWLGVATTDGAVGADVGVSSGGVQELIASAAVAVGDVLVPAAAGRIAPIGAGTNYSHVVGIAMTVGAGAASPVRVKMAR
jgi:uncharacterized protein DUF2190